MSNRYSPENEAVTESFCIALGLRLIVCVAAVFPVLWVIYE